MPNEQDIACIFKALSDENRIRILKILHGGEKCACQLLDELNISQPTLSHHMKMLCDVGIVVGRKEGKWTYYSICCEGTRQIRDLMKQLLSAERFPSDCR